MYEACTTFQKLHSTPVSRSLRQCCIALSMKWWQGSHYIPAWLHNLTGWHLSSGHCSCRRQGMLPLACRACICAAFCPAALGTAPATCLTPAASTISTVGNSLILLQAPQPSKMWKIDFRTETATARDLGLLLRTACKAACFNHKCFGMT